ncbi:TAFII55 protein conserved region-domain-containing protein [Cokeromyces recurvatus]|uniref:TAFII55 protein conserved region-domain-containing protein n=1 Tax=Cokeromyces recurvatus TaxID=90255 RepID=UPI0022204A6A|nr:TAFII55 protein conserved region-domain-containing protein [Cokeromyces recurvatus]KAI7908226.1 TAFII55 protein conserved region-domain-containing protein [Cokeromyces recurvatus]
MESTAKETKTVKIRRPRQPKTEGNTAPLKKDKTIKIKLTARKNNKDEDRNIAEEDDEEPEAVIEEQLIFRVPEGELCDRLHELVKKREIPEDVKLNFKDNRKGSFTFEGRKYDALVVDLPTIIEAQKSLDKKQFYKVADISQMILVDPTSGPEPFIPQINNKVDTDPYSFPHGLTPPLKHVRKRRFRKKLSKRAIEEVEREVERLLEIDATAEDVQYEVVDNREMEMEVESDAGTQDIDIDDDVDESESDEDLAAAIDRDLEMMDEEDEDNEDEDDEDDDDDESEEDEDEEDAAQTGEIEQKRQEIAELKQAIQRKTRDLSTAPNAMLKTRFETDINNLKKALTLKEAHLAEMNEKEKDK